MNVNRTLKSFIYFFRKHHTEKQINIFYLLLKNMPELVISELKPYMEGEQILGKEVLLRDGCVYDISDENFEVFKKLINNTYGFCVIIKKFGCPPCDKLMDFLAEMQQAGKIVIPMGLIEFANSSLYKIAEVKIILSGKPGSEGSTPRILFFQNGKIVPKCNILGFNVDLITTCMSGETPV